jgi:hypothetical protein
MQTIRLANPERPGHHVVIELADDDHEPEAASCECGATWQQCSHDTASVWASVHIPPPHIIRGRITGRSA